MLGKPLHRTIEAASWAYVDFASNVVRPNGIGGRAAARRPDTFGRGAAPPRPDLNARLRRDMLAAPAPRLADRG